MRSTHIVLLLVALVSFAVPALAQEATDVAGASASAIGIILRETATGAVAVLCLVGIVVKDRQITKERDAATEKILALSIAHAAESAKATALMDRIVRYLEKGSA